MSLLDRLKSVAGLWQNTCGRWGCHSVLAESRTKVLSGVVEQFRLGELNLAVSEPWCATSSPQRRGDLMEDARNLLRLVYGDKSNLTSSDPSSRISTNTTEPCCQGDMRIHDRVSERSSKGAYLTERS